MGFLRNIGKFVHNSVYFVVPFPLFGVVGRVMPMGMGCNDAAEPGRTEIV